ncbi:hypothetical protein NQ314_010680 [Rhamnusium bicolor]|uniref:Secreted protein n=1 Tax=Rhamnusium bicolor TaxID=1586634 RepID=A0AAV8XP00_9CUCU|nr:hypothetical protein NQ314_010680 [Rhamnusium bicolor]
MVITSFVNHEVNAAVAPQSFHYDVHGNYLPETKRYTDAGSSCCIIPTCDESGQCYETLSCGYICSQGRHRPANYGATPGYRLKEYYTKNDCHFGECKDFKFLCTHCPDPNEADFSIYTVRRDCKYCYH